MRLSFIILAFLAAAGYAADAESGELDAPSCASECISSTLGVVTDGQDCLSQGLNVLEQTLKDGNATATSDAAVAGKACVCVTASGDTNAAVVQCLQQRCAQFEQDVVNALKTVCKGNSKPLDVSDDPRDGTGAAPSLHPLTGAVVLPLAGLLFSL